MRYDGSPFPWRFFLDTCVVQYLVWMGDHIWDGDSSVLESDAFGRAGTVQQDEYMALDQIFWPKLRAPFQVVISQTVVAELARTRDPVKQRRLLTYALALLDHWETWKWHAGYEPPSPAVEGLCAGLLRSGELDILPDSNDRRLVTESLLNDCHVFLTTDRKTIWRHRAALRRWGINILRPTELWNQLKPWAALWS